MAGANTMVTVERVPSDLYVDFDTDTDATGQYNGHQYFFELVKGDREFRELTFEAPFVGYVSKDDIPAYVGTFTINGHWEEHEGYRKRIIKMAGRSGFTPNALIYFRQFRNFFEGLQRKKSENKNAFTRGIDYRLVINMPFEGVSDYCNLTSFSWERDRSKTTMSYVWSLAVETYGYSARKWTGKREYRNKLDIFCEYGSDECHTDKNHKCHYMAVEALEKIPSTLITPGQKKTLDSVLGVSDRISKKLKNTKTKLSWYEDLYAKANAAYVDMDRFWNSLKQSQYVAYIPYATYILGWLSNTTMEAKQMKGMSNTAITLKLLDYATFGVAGDAYSVYKDVYGYSEAIYLNLKDVFTSPNPRPADLYSYTSAERRYDAATTTVLGGENNVSAVSLRVFGNYDYTAAIMSLNGMLDQRTWGNGQPLAKGDTLLVPLVQGLAPVENGDDDLMGADLKVDNYDFVLNSSGDDLVRVVGMDAYRQNTVHRLRTDKNENPVFPTTGITAVNAGELPQLRAVQVAADVQDQIIMDPRTSRIVSMKYKEASPSTIVVDVVLEPVSSSRWNVSFTYTG